MLWETNAWALLPFEALDPQLKVIQMDGRFTAVQGF
jgi:hypothetical protein